MVVVVVYRTPVNGHGSREISERLGDDRAENEEGEPRAQRERSGSEERDEKRVTLFSFQDSVGWDTSSGKAESSGKGNASPIFRKTLAGQVR